MPLHDWSRVDAGLFHDFHQTWAVKLSAAFNQGALPSDYYALLENDEVAPPKARLVRRSEADLYAEKASRVTVRHRHGDVVAVIEIVSPGNKGSRAEFKAFIDKAAALLRQRVHLLLVDLFPPGKRDPQGIHKALWDEFQEEDFELPADKPFTLAAYDAGPPQVAYVDVPRDGCPWAFGSRLSTSARGGRLFSAARLK